jgi:sucrose-6-phosphate hydrolase SacC (GH32 family)
MPQAGTGGDGVEAGAGGEGHTAMVPEFPADADFPYVITSYDEPYRGQFHFSAPMGWLNDANGMWFDAGLYHLSYQAWPYELGGAAKVWGHASSPDLVHWTHWPIMLHPDVNVPGDAWSGSTVVDVDNTSGLKAGDADVLITLYTCTTLGTCLAYSNDRGITWKEYDDNPLALGTNNNNSSRDPHVFWHEPSKKWVTALYEDFDGGGAGFVGTAFYTSSDLKSWSKVSSLAFGFECPDIYELPIDGNAGSTKWVLQDAAGDYLLGSFDGQKFTPDSNEAKNMDSSSTFYASQTFYRRSFPDQRVVQMPWLRHFDHQGKTAPWNQAIGFPLQVELKTFPDGLHVARTPVAEIEKLYEASQALGAKVTPSGQNALAGLSSKTFDLSFVLDAAQSKASALELKLGDLTIAIDFAGKKAFGRTFSVLDGKVTVRVLRDWGQLEIFVNDGQIVHTDAVLFDPINASISLTGNGDIGLASGEFHELGRAWPGKAASSSALIDDAAPATTYPDGGNLVNEGRYFAGTCHVTTGTQSFEVQFKGTRVEWYGLLNTDLGMADVFVDGVPYATDLDLYSPVRQNRLLFEKGELTNGEHTLEVVGKNQKNAASSGTALVHDYVLAYVDD